MGSIVATARADKNGKRVTVYRAHVRRKGYASASKVCATMHEAKEWLRENEGTANLKRPGSGKTLAAVVEALVEAPPMRGTKFWAPYQLDYWVAELGALDIGEIKRGHINAAAAKLMNRPAMRKTPAGLRAAGRKITAGTVNRYLAALSSVFNFAMLRGIIDVHPMKAGAVARLEENKGRTRILTAEEEQRLLDAAKRSDYPLLPLYLRLLLTSAARKSEVLKLRWADLRLDDNIAVLQKTKSGRPRALPIVSDVKAALQQAQKVKPLTSDFIFFDPKRPDRPIDIDIPWRRCREAAGLLNDRDDPLDRVYLHSTRHTAVTRLLKGGANIAQAAAVSGHQTLAMLKRYEHLAAADTVELAERLLAGNKK